MTYLRPVNPTGICSYYTHTRRTTPSLEAGVDYYCPIGTPVHAAANGVVADVGGSISAATGRYVTIDLDDGRRVRYLHLSAQLVRVGQRVKQGDVVAKSGASGYGSEFFGARTLAGIPANTGGPHVHTTLWAGHYYQFGRYPLEPTLDFERFVGGTPAGGNATPFQEDDMGTLENTEENYKVFATWLQRALKFDVRPNGLGATYTLGPTIFELLNAADDSADVKAIKPTLSADQIKAVADAVIAQIKVPAPSIDYAKIAKTVNDEEDRREAIRRQKSV